MYRILEGRALGRRNSFRWCTLFMGVVWISILLSQGPRFQVARLGFKGLRSVLRVLVGR